MKYFLIFFSTLSFLYCLPLQKNNSWYPAYTKLSLSDFNILENSYATLKTDPLDNPRKNRKDILLLALSYLYQKDLDKFRELFNFFLQHIKQRDGDELISYIPAFVELIKFQNKGIQLHDDINNLLQVYEDKVSAKELSNHPLHRFYYSQLIAYSIPSPLLGKNPPIAKNVHALQKGLPYKSSYCLYQQSILLMDYLHLEDKPNERQIRENQLVLASWIQATKFANAEASVLMNEYQSIQKPSLYQHKEYKKAISLCISIYQHFRSKVLYFLRKRSFHEKQLPGIYKNRAFSLHRFYSASNNKLQKILQEIQNPIVKSDCVEFSNEFQRHIKKMNLLSEKPIEFFDSSVDLDEALEIYRLVFVKAKLLFKSESMIPTCLDIYPIRYE